jgi:lipoyl(octanoyl) transferase
MLRLSSPGRIREIDVSHSVHLLQSPLLAYRTAWDWQLAAADSLQNGGDEYLALLQHPPVFTFGRNVRPQHLLFHPERLASLGAEVVESDRGGDITFHGPGQLVGYPILDLRRRNLGATDYVRALEETLVQALAHFEIAAERSPGFPGVWVDGAKIAAIGVRIRGGVATHGFALNVETDLSWFEAIVPCGLVNAGLTSMQRLLGTSPGIPAVAIALRQAFCRVFDSVLIEAIESERADGRRARGPRAESLTGASPVVSFLEAGPTGKDAQPIPRRAVAHGR